MGNKFQIFTDRQSLKQLMTQTIQTPEQQKWAYKLQGYEFDVIYKPGRSNVVADALSRQFTNEETDSTPDSGSLLFAITSPVPRLISQLKDYFRSEPLGQEFINQFISNDKFQSQAHVKSHLLFYRDRLVIPTEAMQQELLAEFHNSPTAGHSGVKATLARLAASFFWPEMYADTKAFISTCTTCQQSKPVNQKKSGLLQPLPQPRRVWEDITMDFITHLPMSFGHSAIWVVCDRLTKAVHFMGLPNHYTTVDLARRFMVEIFRLHGFPKSIVSDRDPIFMSKFWKELFYLQGTKLRFSSAYHPETDGQSEVVNMSLEIYLRCFAGENPRSWFRFLHLVEYWFNTSHHSAIGMTLFQAMFGRPPPSLIDYIEGTATTEAIESNLHQRKLIIQALRTNLKRTRQSMKDKANAHRRDISFKPEQFVWLRLRPYRQQSVQKRPYHKLSKRFFGPFRIIRRIDAVAYELDLPEDSRMHPVVHVSLLWPYRGRVPPLELLSSSLPTQAAQNPPTTHTPSGPTPSLQHNSETKTEVNKPSFPSSHTLNPMSSLSNTRVAAQVDLSTHLANLSVQVTKSPTRVPNSAPLPDTSKTLHSPPFDPISTTISQSCPSARSTIRAIPSSPTNNEHVSNNNLEDKVLVNEECIVTRPKRKIRKPKKYLD